MKFTDILQKHNIPYKAEGHHHCRPGWVQLDCPYCSKGSGRFRLGFNIYGKYLNCWVCGKLKTINTVADLTGEHFKQVAAWLNDVDRERDRTAVVKRGKLVVPAKVGPLLKPHVEYLRSRRFQPDEIVKLWGVQGIGQAARLKWRLFIPFVFQGEVVSWTTRAIGDGGGRYISAEPQEESIAMSEMLYGEDYCRNAVVVHEGPTDVWRTGPGAVATMGLKCSSTQLLRIAKYPVRVICFDNEEAAQRRADKLANDLSVLPGETYKVQLDSKDAGSATKKEIKVLRKFLNAQ